jgi:hypothetical protein
LWALSTWSKNKKNEIYSLLGLERPYFRCYVMLDNEEEDTAGTLFPAFSRQMNNTKINLVQLNGNPLPVSIQN